MTKLNLHKNFNSISEKKIFILRVYKFFIFSLLHFVFYCFIGLRLNFDFSIWWVVLWLGNFYLCLKIKKSLFALFFYTGVSGFLISPIINIFVVNGRLDLIVYTLFNSMAIFISLISYVYFTKNDYKKLNALLFILFFPTLLAILFSFYYENEIYEIILSTFMAVLGGLYVIYDTSYLLKDNKPGDEVIAALELHLDIRLIFSRILDVFGESNDVYDTNIDDTPDLDFE